MAGTLRRQAVNDRGQALPLALVALAMGALLVGGFLSSTSTGLVASRVFGQPLPGRYAADAGVEDAIWNLVYGDLVTTVLTSPGDQVSYSLTEPVNGLTTNVTVTRGQSVIARTTVAVASDDFESKGWSGGSGWLHDWYYEGSCTITSAQSPHGGSYHLQMRGADSYVDRAADLSGYSGLHLQFWAKVRSFEGDDSMNCLVSPDGSQWTTVKTWTRTDSDNTYHFVDIDLSPYAMSSEYWVAFHSEMNASNDYFYVDELEIVGAVTYEIVSTAAGKTVRSTVEFGDTGLTVLSWEIE
ncbi:MAG: hypothetical protein AB1603_05495 [Chloroflexota bacterium]